MNKSEKLDEIIKKAEVGTLELDDEERELQESYERGEWKSIPNVEAEIKRYQEAAREWRMIQSACNTTDTNRRKERPT